MLVKKIEGELYNIVYRESTGFKNEIIVELKGE